MPPLPNDRNARMGIEALRLMAAGHAAQAQYDAAMAAQAADMLLAQWHAARGSWEREDCADRIEATVRFYETHEWNDETQRWRNENAR